jgi:hypothetical protein
MGTKRLALSFENIIVSFCFLPCLFLFAICNQSVSSYVIVYILDSEGLSESLSSWNCSKFSSSALGTLYRES